MTQDKTEIEKLKVLVPAGEYHQLQHIARSVKDAIESPIKHLEEQLKDVHNQLYKAHESEKKWKTLYLEVFDSRQELQAKVQELEAQVSHLEGVSDGYAVVEMEDKAKIKSLQSELSALKSENEKLKEFERKRWESAVGTLGITPPKPEKKSLSDKEQKE